jgi:glycerol kinase
MSKSSAYILVIDQGTTSTRAVVFDDSCRVCGNAAREIRQHYPQPGWVEHDAEEIWNSAQATISEALSAAGIVPNQIAAIGLSNQRETVVLWDRKTGRPVAHAIVWQDRRTAPFCRERQSDEKWLTERTGLILDPYFSATKLNWLLTQNPEWRTHLGRGDLACGTIDSYLLFRLTGGAVYATDVTNASRTLLLNLRTTAWDEELCRYFDIPLNRLPTPQPSASDYGTTRGLAVLPDGIPIRGVAGDQQAALFGQAAFSPGESKCTYGTGAFFLLHTGTTPVVSQQRLLSTVAATTDSTPQYALEGSVFVAGAAIQWLREGLQLIDAAHESEALATASDDNLPVVFVPGFVGLGAPHWHAEARGALLGLTRNTGPAELARAALEGVAFQVADLIEAAAKDAGTPLHDLRADGGMARNSWFLQRQADVLGLPVMQAGQSEATAMGAAFLAGLRAGVWSSLDQLRNFAATTRRFEPHWGEAERTAKLQRWRAAVQAVIGFAGNS